jgi:SAM-dependent methyltransferase
MADLGGGGYHWQAKELVDDWDEMQRRVEAEREKGFRRILDHLPADRSATIRIVDMGAGDGKVASVVLENYPNAYAVLVDFSGPMIAKGTRELRSYGGRWHYLYWDMNEGEFPEELDGPFDGVVSSAAIHHLKNDRKAWLAQQIAARLVPGGSFINYDLFRDPDAVFDEEDIHGRTCATIDEATAFMRSAGYEGILADTRFYVETQKGEMAVLAGHVPAR